MTLTQNTDIENYHLGSVIRRDDVTTMYIAERLPDHEAVTLRMVAPHYSFDEQFIRQFIAIYEQNILLDHPHILRTYEAQQQGDTVYVVQAALYGKSLHEMLESDGTFSPKRTLKIAQQIAVALDYAHEQEMVHGDLSTECIYLEADDYVLLTDFGKTQAMLGTSLVKKGYPLGSPETIAPEQMNGQHPTHLSDLYGLGVICYQMLTNSTPFSGTLPTILHAQAYETPRPLNLLNPAISSAISRVIERMLAKQPESRYSTATAFVDALREAVEGKAHHQTEEDTVPRVNSYIPIHPKAADIPTRRVERTLRNSTWQLWVGAGLIIAVIMFFFAWSIGMVSVWQISKSDKAVTPLPIVLTTPRQPTFTPTTPPTEPATPSQTATLIPPPTPPTMGHLPTPGLPTVAVNSPFSNLILAANITSENQPDQVGTAFNREDMPLYLFFDYDNLEPGMAWGHRWVWGDSEIAQFQAVWPTDYDRTGNAWVYFNPSGGYQSGPYLVNLEVEGRIVATATFVILP